MIQVHKGEKNKEIVGEVSFNLAKYGKSSSSVTEKLSLTGSDDPEAFVEIMVKIITLDRGPSTPAINSTQQYYHLKLTYPTFI